jgi:hypothetical protein
MENRAVEGTGKAVVIAPVELAWKAYGVAAA